MSQMGVPGPRLDELAGGPCETAFKAMSSCVVDSKEAAERKGSDCREQIVALLECFQRHPRLYPLGGEKEPPAAPGCTGNQQPKPIQSYPTIFID